MAVGPPAGRAGRRDSRNSEWQELLRANPVNVTL